jgi:hypothetical protein
MVVSPPSGPATTTPQGLIFVAVNGGKTSLLPGTYGGTITLASSYRLALPDAIPPAAGCLQPARIHSVLTSPPAKRRLPKRLRSTIFLKLKPRSSRLQPPPMARTGSRYPTRTS